MVKIYADIINRGMFVGLGQEDINLPRARQTARDSQRRVSNATWSVLRVYWDLFEGVLGEPNF